MKTLTRGIAARIISVVLVLMMLFSLCTVGMTSAFAADVDLAQTGVNIEGGTKLYLKANDNWLSDSARFAAYYYGDSGEAWASLTAAEGENIYVVDTPSGTWSNIIFCRMDPSSDENDWGYIWNQTSDLEYDGVNNMYVMEAGEWDWGYSEWTVYTPPVPDVPEVTVEPGDPSSVNIMGFDGDWTTGINMIYSENTDVVTATKTLIQGAYEFKIKNGDSLCGNSTAISNATGKAGLVLDADVNCLLNATGGTYVFNYTISTNTLNVTYTPTSGGGIGGDSDLLDLAESTDPTLRINKETFTLGEPIYVTADNGVWVGIYKSDVTDYAHTKSSVWYYVDDYKGEALDIRTLYYNNNVDYTADPQFYAGSYKAVLFGTANQSDPITSVNFEVVDANYMKSGNNILSSDKDTYFYGEPIMVTGWTDRPDLTPWICLVERGATPSSNTLLYWHYVANNSFDNRNVSQNLIDVSDINTGVAVPPGEYDLHLFRTGSYTYDNCVLPITVTEGNGTVWTDKDTYGIFEDIYVTANHKNYGPGAWVGVFAEATLGGKVPTNASGLKAWYYVDDQVSYTVNLRDIEDNEYGEPLKFSDAREGVYSVYLFDDNTYSKIQHMTTFTVEGEMNGHFSSGAYRVDNLTDGFSNGTVALEVDPEHYNLIDVADVRLYWGDANGNPLADYTAFSWRFVDLPIVTFDMYTHTIIPEGAKTLVAYMGVDNYGNYIQGDEGYVIPLPEGTVTYSGLDTGITSEFSLISDTHITSDAVSTYPDGSNKYHSWQQDTSNEYFEIVLNDIADISPQSSGIFINGDVANNGFAQEYAEASSIYNKVKAERNLPNVYATMGNHDTYVGNANNYINFVNSIGGNVSKSTLYYSKTVNGYKYIFLAGDNSDYYGNNTAAINASDAELSDAQLAWLDEQLADNRDNNGGKPVFIFLHQAIEDTVAGTFDGQDWYGLVNADDLEAVVKKYDNVYLVGGHSHWLLDSPNNIFPGSNSIPVAVNAASTSYLWSDYANLTSHTIMGAQGYIVRTYEDKVVFLGRDHTSGKWIPEACHVFYNDDVSAESVTMDAETTLAASGYMTNPNNRTITYTSSNSKVATVAADGTITAVGAGKATISYTAAASDTEVIKRDKFTVTVNEVKTPSSVNLMGINDDWATGINMTYSVDSNVVSATVELAAGTHQFKIKNGDAWHGNAGTIEDTTTATSATGWVMDNDANCKLQASGGTYTFIYTISTNSLVVTYEAPNFEENGANTATIYVNTANSSFEGTPYIYIWDPDVTVNQNIGPTWPGKLMEGPNAEGYYYRTFNFDESYQFIVNNNNGLQTEDSAVHNQKELYITFTGDTEYVVSKAPEFWVDLNPQDDSSNLDILYPEYIDGTWYLFLPSGVNAANLEFHYTEGASLDISYITVANGGTINLSGGVNSTGTSGYVLGGSFSGYLKLKQSANVATVYTNTNEAVPQGTGYGDHKDDYSSKGTIMVTNSDGSIRLSEELLKKIKGRGNSTWEASNEIIGKYAFNITLDEETGLIDSESITDRYCLVSFNSDEARMRNMLIYDLAKNIGIDFVANFEPVDLYNNGYYIGSYLLVEKNEIGNPLIDILDLDNVNANVSNANKTLYNDESNMNLTAVGGDLTTTSGAGFYKYASNLEEPDPSVYENGGFLLEFELDERFAEEPSGFISENGQQIIVQGPEYATKNEIEFIMDKWNEAEALMYDEDATYEQLDAVIDVESFAKMYLIQELSKNLDAGATSYFVYYDGGKLHAGVAWDYDWTLGQYIQSGDGNLSVDNQTSGKFDSEANKLLNDPEGWWANSKEIYPNTGTLNAQAALCQNENFWNVVKAEWNEVFYNEAILYADSTASSVGALDGKIRELYYSVHPATLMDEAKWGIIASDPLESWGSEDTGDTHDAAVVYLNDYYYNRLQWMNTKLTSDSYTLAAPELESSDDSCNKGDIITLTASTASSGTLKYNFYDPDGNLIKTVTSSTGVATCDVETAHKGSARYSVKVTSDNTVTESAEAYVTVDVKSTALDITLEAPESVVIGSEISIKATPNTDENVNYTFFDASGAVIGTNTNGEFTYATTAGDDGKTLTFIVTADATIDEVPYSVSKSVDVKVTPIIFDVELTAEKTTVEFGNNISLTAQASSPNEITYYFYDAVTNDLIATNTTGTMDEATTAEDIGTTRSYYVRATTNVLGMIYEAYSDDISVTITEIKEVYNVNIYFKSTSTYGYAPMITTKGALTDVSDQPMTRDIFICKNATETASYFWYKTTAAVPKSSGELTVTVLSSRYAMEATTTLEISADGDIYLAVDNLNNGDTIINLSEADEKERNWCQSAVHMVYDPKYDSAESLAEVTARVDLRYVGDTNADGKLNIRDATYIQKALAQLVILDSTSAEVADVDCDGRVTIKDATAIQRKLVALP